MDENKHIERLMFYLIRHSGSWDLPQAYATFNYGLIAEMESDIFIFLCCFCSEVITLHYICLCIFNHI